MAKTCIAADRRNGADARARGERVGRDTEADRHRRPRLHDHAEEGRQEGDEAQGRQVHVRDQRQGVDPQLQPRRPERASQKTFTSVPFKGTKTITMTLKKGKYKFYCEPHESTMFGNFTVS